MTKKKLAPSELKQKKQTALLKKYTDVMVDASKLKKYEKGTPNTGYLKTIILSAATTQQAAEADANRIEIDIPKDFLLKSSKLLTVEAGTGAQEGKWIVTKENNVAVETPYEAPASVTGAGQWIDLVVNTVGDDATSQHICVDLSSFVDVYSGGNGINVANKVISIQLNATASGLEVDANGLKVKIDSTNANGLAITADGLKLATATSTSAGAMSANDKKNVDQELMTDAEMASWLGWDITGTPATGSVEEAVKNMLTGISDDSITDE